MSSLAEVLTQLGWSGSARRSALMSFHLLIILRNKTRSISISRSLCFREILHTSHYWMSRSIPATSAIMSRCAWCHWAGTRKVKPIWIYWSKKQWVAVASAGPHANLHLTTPQTGNHASTSHSVFFHRPGALPAIQPTASKHCRQVSMCYSATSDKKWRILLKQSFIARTVHGH